MIDRLKKIFAREPDEAGEQDDTEAVHLAVAVLLVEIARADFAHREAEEQELLLQLKDATGLPEAESRELLQQAKDCVEHSVSLHKYTRDLHTRMSYDEKQAVVERLWRIAMADHDLDKYEDYMIGKIADLLYVSRGDVIRLRHRVTDETPKDNQ